VYEEQPSSSIIQGGSRMRESRSYGSVRGAISDGRPYRDSWRLIPDAEIAKSCQRKVEMSGFLPDRNVLLQGFLQG
jgi:hypothetical protein